MYVLDHVSIFEPSYDTAAPKHLCLYAHCPHKDFYFG